MQDAARSMRLFDAFRALRGLSRQSNLVRRTATLCRVYHQFTGGEPMNIKIQNAAKRYLEIGFSVLPVNGEKNPTLKTWKKFQTVKPTIQNVEKWFADRAATGIAIIAGEISGNIEVIDVDCKHDLTGTLWTDYSNLIKEHDPELFRKLVIAKTVSNGFHITYRTNVAAGNKKLAQRPVANAEKAERLKTSPNQNVDKARKDLIETRGEGGYFLVMPSPGYEFIQGDLSDISFITDDERDLLFTLARLFDEVSVNVPAVESVPEAGNVRETTATENGNGFDAWQDYNNRADTFTVTNLLEKHGWKKRFQSGETIKFTRPGKTNNLDSANYHTGKKVFFVHTTSTVFDNKGYSPVMIFTLLEHGDDRKSAFKALLTNGYGTPNANSNGYQTTNGNQSGATVQRVEDFDKPPVELPDDVDFVPELPDAMLPESWRKWLVDAAERFQCPIDYAAIPALCGASTLIGNKVKMRVKDKDIWTVTGNFWGAVIGRSGTGKSPMMEEGLFAFYEIAQRLADKFQKEQVYFEADSAYFKAKRSELEKDARGTKDDAGISKDAFRKRWQENQDEKPVAETLWSSDSTIEALANLLNDNPNGLMMRFDEITSWLRGFERQGHEQDRSFYLSCAEGKASHQIHRISRPPLFCKNMTLSICGGIQPMVFAPYLKQAVRTGGGDGLIARFALSVHPPEPKEYEHINREPKGRESVRRVFDNLHNLTPETCGAKRFTKENGDDYFFQFSPEAQEFYAAWDTELQREIRREIEVEVLRAHLSKYKSLLPSLAKVFYLIDFVDGKTTDSTISLYYAELAAAWCAYLRAHAQKMYNIAITSDLQAGREIIKLITDKKPLPEIFTERDIKRRNRTALSESEAIKDGLDLLVEHGFIFRASPADNNLMGRPTARYFAHKTLTGK